MRKEQLIYCSIGLDQKLGDLGTEALRVKTTANMNIPSGFRVIHVHDKNNFDDMWAREFPNYPITVHLPDGEYKKEDIDEFCENLWEFCDQRGLSTLGRIDLDDRRIIFPDDFQTGWRTSHAIEVKEKKPLKDAVSAIHENLDALNGEDIDALFLALAAEARIRQDVDVPIVTMDRHADIIHVNRNLVDISCKREKGSVWGVYITDTKGKQTIATRYRLPDNTSERRQGTVAREIMREIHNLIRNCPRNGYISQQKIVKIVQDACDRTGNKENV